jgi:hypothetical protein
MAGGSGSELRTAFTDNHLGDKSTRVTESALPSAGEGVEERSFYSYC